MRKPVFAIALALSFSAWADEATGLPKPLQKSFEEHCLECHDSDTKKGGLDLTKLRMQFQDSAQFAEWVKVHDRVRSGEMPPKKKTRPPQADVALITNWLNSELSAADAERQKKDVRAGVRRLSRVEFENTLRDLLGLPGLRVLTSLPSDGKAFGLERSAEALGGGARFLVCSLGFVPVGGGCGIAGGDADADRAAGGFQFPHHGVGK